MYFTSHSTIPLFQHSSLSTIFRDFAFFTA